MSNLKPKRHCMVVHAYYPIGETRVEREALALVDAGYEVDVICLSHKGDPKYESIDGVGVYRLPVSRKRVGGVIGQLLEYLLFFIFAFFKLSSLYFRQKYQTVQAHNLPDFLVFSAILPKLFGARLILDLHDLMPEFYAAKMGVGMENVPVRLVIFQERLSCWFADHVITVTDLWRKRLIDRGVPDRKVSVVMNLPDERYFSSNHRYEESNMARTGLRLMYHGTFKEHYGLKELIQAIQIVREQIPELHLTLQGVGEYASEMFKLVEDFNLENEVTINNYALPVGELPDLIHQANIGIIPNRNDVFTGDLLPTKMMEYVALGLPVIAARTRAISQYFDEDLIQFFTPGDANSLANEILNAYRHWNEVSEKTKNYHQFTSIHNWQKMSKFYVELVDSLRTKH